MVVDNQLSPWPVYEQDEIDAESAVLSFGRVVDRTYQRPCVGSGLVEARRREHAVVSLQESTGLGHHHGESGDDKSAGLPI